jgi:DNA-directed RNA polymerase specialized sigma24 family protein
MNLLEEAAATVSEAVLAKQATELPPIRDLRAYLYRAFLRRVSAHRQVEIRLEEAFEDHFRLNEGMSYEEKLEARLLIKKILCMCDRKTMWIIWERIEGRSWNEIAYDMGMSNHAARLHYSRVLREIREAFESNPQTYVEKLRQEQLERQRKARLNPRDLALGRYTRRLSIRLCFGSSKPGRNSVVHSSAQTSVA